METQQGTQFRIAEENVRLNMFQTVIQDHI